MSAAVTGARRPAAGTRVSLRRWAVWASVALNVFLVALVGTHQVGHWLQAPSPPGLEGFGERLARDLPPADAERFRTAMRHEAPLLRAAQDRLDDARAALSRSVARTPYDEALVRQRLSELQQRWQELSERFAEALAPTLASLSDDGREKLAAALERPRPPPGRRPPPGDQRSPAGDHR